MEHILLYIYRMSLDNLALVAVFAALIFCTLFHKCAGQNWPRPCICGMLAVWVGVVLWVTILNRSVDSSYRFSPIPLHTYWSVFTGGDQELLRSAFMNVVLFYPAGLLLGSLTPEKWSSRRGMICSVLALMLFSMAIEMTQYFRQLGNAEFDDILHNTLGAVAGISAFRTFSKSIKLEKWL